jgi:mediator of RNA polymerase II transcription subunit 31
MQAESAPDRQALPSPDKRFLIELEFVQNLANAKYLNYLAQSGYFEQESFINFLKYLQYWKKPEYIKNLLFPQCLAFLDALVENPAFRRELALPQFMDFVHQQQGSHWMFGNRDPMDVVDVPTSDVIVPTDVSAT